MDVGRKFFLPEPEKDIWLTKLCRDLREEGVCLSRKSRRNAKGDINWFP